MIFIRHRFSLLRCYCFGSIKCNSEHWWANWCPGAFPQKNCRVPTTRQLLVKLHSLLQRCISIQQLLHDAIPFTDSLSGDQLWQCGVCCCLHYQGSVQCIWYLHVVLIPQSMHVVICKQWVQLGGWHYSSPVSTAWGAVGVGSFHVMLIDVCTLFLHICDHIRWVAWKESHLPSPCQLRQGSVTSRWPPSLSHWCIPLFWPVSWHPWIPFDGLGWCFALQLLPNYVDVVGCVAYVLYVSSLMWSM